ncbi:cadmium resistance transporter [Nonomuraea sp. NPDC049725]|uniref:cadmium resistance transporter n=1 Tax=Nonomuraea sp. NPDC049725 TaxID=3154508 RepID=UPI003425D057
MNVGVVGQAAGLFAVTNVDDLVILALFFARGAGSPGAAARVVAGQYLGFLGILAVAVVAASGAALLPEPVLPYLGLLPLLLGLKAAWQAWRSHRDGEDEGPGEAPAGGPRAWEVAAVTFANGGDNIGVYVPVFTTAGAGSTTVHIVVFLALVAVWCAVGRFFATRPVVARTLSRWGHVLLPLVLSGIGVAILVEGGAFGL